MKTTLSILFICFSLNTVSATFSKETSIEIFVTAIKEDNFNYITSVLRSKQLNVNQAYNGKSLLFYAIDFDNAEMVNLLVRYGARLDLTNDAGETPLEYAKSQNKILALAELIVIMA